MICDESRFTSAIGLNHVAQLHDEEVSLSKPSYRKKMKQGHRYILDDNDDLNQGKRMTCVHFERKGATT